MRNGKYIIVTLAQEAAYFNKITCIQLVMRMQIFMNILIGCNIVEFYSLCIHILTILPQRTTKYR